MVVGSMQAVMAAGPRPMRSRWLLTAVATGLLLTASACSGTPDPTTTATAAPTTIAAPTTTTSAPTTTTTPATTTTQAPTTTLAQEAVGDPELLQAMIDDIAQAWFGVDAAVAGVPIPDLTNPDPVVAVGDIYRLDAWLAQSPDTWGEEWVAVFTGADTPARTELGNVYSSRLLGNEIAVNRGDPWAFHGGRVVDIAETSLSLPEVTALPSDAVGVVFHSSIGPYEFVDADTGEVRETQPGWDADDEWLVVVAPSPHGWVLHHELFE